MHGGCGRPELIREIPHRVATGCVLFVNRAVASVAVAAYLRIGQLPRRNAGGDELREVIGGVHNITPEERERCRSVEPFAMTTQSERRVVAAPGPVGSGLPHTRAGGHPRQ